MICEKTERFCSLAAASAEASTLKNAVLSAPRGGDVIKIKCTPHTYKDRMCIQFEYFCTEGRVRHENVAIESFGKRIGELCGNFSRLELNDSGGSASLLTSKKGKVTLLVRGNIGGGEKIGAAEKTKNYILDGSEQFLYHLGISDKNGRVHDKKQAKYRQINRFLEHIGDAAAKLPKGGELRVADLCCGKSYLSFAVYHYLTVTLGREVVMDCVDLKESVMEQCADIAQKCGFLGMRFTAGDVSKYSPERPPHMVISLHACDIATDIVLDRAVYLRAEVILSTPCCHRDLSRRLKCEPLSFVAKNSVLRSKLCDAATDALRVLRLEACGYVTDAVELIDPEDTPKNVLIRAYRSRKLVYGNKTEQKLCEYKAAYRFLTGADAPEIIPQKEWTE